MINFEEFIKKSDDFLLVSDIIRYNDGKVIKRLYNGTYSQEVLLYYWNKRSIQPGVVEDLSEFYNTANNTTFWIYMDVNSEKTLITDLNHSHTYLIMQIAETKDLTSSDI